MEKTFTIQEAQRMAGMIISRIKGKVVSIYDRTTGEGEYGPWSLQNGMIEDSTGKMKILFKNMVDQKPLTGRTLVFKSMETAKGLKGVQVKKKEYQGKETIELHVTGVALIIGDGVSEDVQPVQTSPRQQNLSDEEIDKKI